MAASKYVGRTPNSNASMVPKGHVDTRHGLVAVTPEYISATVAAHAASVNLVDQAYVDTRDATRAKKAVVDTADALYLPSTARGANNGVASTGASGTVPAGQLPAGLITSLPCNYYEASTINLVANQTVTSSTTKTYQAGILNIPDQGHAYTVWAFASVLGRCPGVFDHSRRLGGGHRGKMNILTSTDQLLSGGVAGNSMGSTWYPVLPTAILNATPTTLIGASTLNLWLSLLSGTSYIFEPVPRFWCFVFPAG